MDVVIAYLATKFGMLLSRSWEKRARGTLHMDMSYATIPLFGGEHRRIYREVQLSYLVNDNKNPMNHPIYAIQEDMGSCMLHLVDDATSILQIEKDHSAQHRMDIQDCLWKMYFDGSSCKEGARVGIVLISPWGEIISLVYKL